MYRRSSVPPPPNTMLKLVPSFTALVFPFLFGFQSVSSSGIALTFGSHFPSPPSDQASQLQRNLHPGVLFFTPQNCGIPKVLSLTDRITCYHQLVIVQDRVVYSVLEIWIYVNQPEHYWTNIILVFIIHTSSRFCERKPTYALANFHVLRCQIICLRF